MKRKRMIPAAVLLLAAALTACAPTGDGGRTETAEYTGASETPEDSGTETAVFTAGPDTSEEERTACFTGTDTPEQDSIERTADPDTPEEDGTGFTVVPDMSEVTDTEPAEEENELGYIQTDAQTAKQMMDTQTGYVILDVRTDAEYAEGHIPGAVLIPDYEIRERAEGELTDKGQLILVYCRSGNRSKTASAILAGLGYTNVVEFGGIRSWPYEIEK